MRYSTRGKQKKNRFARPMAHGLMMQTRTIGEKTNSTANFRTRKLP